jgi:hypothetical protein
LPCTRIDRPPLVPPPELDELEELLELLPELLVVPPEDELELLPPELELEEVEPPTLEAALAGTEEVEPPPEPPQAASAAQKTGILKRQRLLSNTALLHRHIKMPKISKQPPAEAARSTGCA